MKLRAAVVASALLVGAATSAAGASCRHDLALISGQGLSISFNVEIADDDIERARGLMFRRELAQGKGMLFIYERPSPVSFWMKNTLIPLDIVFIDDTGEVRHVHPMAKPLDETPVPGALPSDPNPERLMVLEIAGGEAERLGIKAGMVLSHPAVPQTTAKSPCS